MSILKFTSTLVILLLYCHVTQKFTAKLLFFDESYRERNYIVHNIMYISLTLSYGVDSRAVMLTTEFLVAAQSKNSCL